MDLAGARPRRALIVLDPRETPIARTADLWLPVRPGTDIAVLNAMLRIVIDEGLVDEAYVAARTTGWDEVKAAVAANTRRRRPSGSPAFPPRASSPPRGSMASARDLADHARPRHRAQHARRGQLPRLHQSGAGARAGSASPAAAR